LPIALITASVALHVLLLWMLSWTWRMAALWALSLVVVTWLSVQPWPMRSLALVAAAGWLVMIFVADRSPLGELVGPEREWQDTIHGVSARAREDDAAGRLDPPTLASRIWELERLDPPPGPWALAVAAQLLDLRARPPQTDAPGATDRLVAWPWRAALDSRLIPPRLWLRDAVRRRHMRTLETIEYDRVTREVQYDIYFLRVAGRRFAALRQAEGGLAGNLDEARAVIALLRYVSPPARRWASVRDRLAEVLELEVQDVEGGRVAERHAAMSAELMEHWMSLERAALAPATLLPR
jgi:hypothetical protein